MRNASEDQRVYKTQKLIRDALCELMLTKNVNEISVRELTEKIHISRGTFYLHYKDIFDLVEKTEFDILQNLDKILSKGLSGSEKTLRQGAVEMFEFFAVNADVCAVLLGEKGNISFLERLTSIIKERSLEHWIIKHNNSDSEYVNYLLPFISAGCVALLNAWLRSGMKETPEEMAIFVENILQRRRER
jgi:AcrR family transcriptional regulator